MMVRLFLALMMLIGLPLVGVSLSPRELGPYFEFPPQTLYVRHAPFVHRFQIFEMPILGSAGYRPFGLECAVLADIVLKKNRDLGMKRPHC